MKLLVTGSSLALIYGDLRFGNCVNYFRCIVVGLPKMKWLVYFLVFTTLLIIVFKIKFSRISANLNVLFVSMEIFL